MFKLKYMVEAFARQGTPGMPVKDQMGYEGAEEGIYLIRTILIVEQGSLGTSH